MTTKEQEKKERTAQEIEAKNQRICQQLVNREVLHCCSTMVYELGKTEGFQDEILELCTGQNWVDAAYDEGWREVPDDAEVDYHYIMDANDANEEAQTSDAETWKELCDEQGINPYDVEVFEHWAVTDWFSEKLKEHGEIVGELFDFTIWGRCITGQAIYMDGIIREIAAEMEILVGQKNEWTD